MRSFRVFLSLGNAGIVTGILFGHIKPWQPPEELPLMRTVDGREIRVVLGDGRELRRVADVNLEPDAPDPWTPPPVGFELVRRFYGWAAPNAWVPT